VRAAALTALVRADSTARDSAVAWGLATPSYQDVIQEAAYRIIAQTRDTAAIPRVEERLATDRSPRTCWRRSRRAAAATRSTCSPPT